MSKTRLVPVPKWTTQPSLFVMIECDGHDDNVFTHRIRRKIWQKHLKSHFLYLQENCLLRRRPSFCEKLSRVATLLLATTRSPRNLHLRILSVRWSAIRCLC